MAIELGPPRDVDEATAFFVIACESLLVSPSLAAGWLEREGIENVRVARVDGKLAGGLAVQRLGQWFGGLRVPCGVVRAVGVAAEHRGSRVADTFLRGSLLELREAGIPISMLFPATQIIYRRVGFEQAGAWLDWSVPVSEMSPRDRALPMSRVPLDDPALPRLYEAFARRSAGMLDRSPWLWRRTIAPIGTLDLAAYLIGPKDAPEGYLIVHTERPPGGQKGALRVRDRAFLTPGAMRRARSFFAEHRSMIDRVLISSGLVEPLFVTLANQLQTIVRREDWMLRLVDVAGALRARGYPAGVSAEVHLLVHDDVLAPHEQRLVLKVRDGAAEVSPGGTGAVELDVRGLAAMYSGFLGAAEVAALGYLTGDLRAGEALGAVFAGPSPWNNEIV